MQWYNKIRYWDKGWKVARKLIILHPYVTKSWEIPRIFSHANSVKLFGDSMTGNFWRVMTNGGQRHVVTLFRPIKHSGHNYSTRLIFIQGSRVPRQNRNAFRITNGTSRRRVFESGCHARWRSFHHQCRRARGRFLIKKQTLSLAHTPGAVAGLGIIYTTK